MLCWCDIFWALTDSLICWFRPSNFRKWATCTVLLSSAMSLDHTTSQMLYCQVIPVIWCTATLKWTKSHPEINHDYHNILTQGNRVVGWGEGGGPADVMSTFSLLLQNTQKQIHWLRFIQALAITQWHCSHTVNWIYSREIHIRMFHSHMDVHTHTHTHTHTHSA